MASCVLMASGLLAENRTNNSEFFALEKVAKVEINAFCKAVMQGNIETVKRLLDLGEDVNKRSLGMTPAIFAARYNQAEVLKVLIANGADLSKKCNKGWDIQKYAKISNSTEVLAILQENT